MINTTVVLYLQGLKAEDNCLCRFFSCNLWMLNLILIMPNADKLNAKPEKIYPPSFAEIILPASAAILGGKWFVLLRRVAR
jgi:hypothetical protein